VLTDLKKILSKFKFKEKAGGDYDVPPTFKEELNRQCSAIALRASILAIFSWPLFIPLDIELHGDIPFIFYLRVGFSVAGFICFLLHFIPFFKKRGYWLMIFILYYLGLATAWILGLVGADPIYMGGFAIVILTIGLVPFQRIHSLLLLMISLVLFTVVGHYKGMELVLPEDTYGLYNLMVSVAIALLAIYIFDNIRKTSYENRWLLQNANEELQKANELKNQLLQVAAHDLKDPLQVIIGYTDLLKMKLRENKFAHERLKIIYRSTDRMIKLIAGLLEITSIESGKLVMHKSEVDLGEVVEASVNSHQRESQKKNQLLHATVEKDCMVYGDQMLLRQIANHLISNAIKFSSPGKSIWVALGQHGDSVVLEVRDEGPGIHEDEKDKLFNKFQRLSTRPTAGEISTGLGLAITRDLVELHNGSITVQSELEKGSTFIVNLPILQKETLGG
jgi:signal transduction histidine kinase